MQQPTSQQSVVRHCALSRCDTRMCYLLSATGPCRVACCITRRCMAAEPRCVLCNAAAAAEMRSRAYGAGHLQWPGRRRARGRRACLQGPSRLALPCKINTPSERLSGLTSARYDGGSWPGEACRACGLAEATAETGRSMRTSFSSEMQLRVVCRTYPASAACARRPCTPTGWYAWLASKDCLHLRAVGSKVQLANENASKDTCMLTGTQASSCCIQRDTSAEMAPRQLCWGKVEACYCVSSTLCAWP